MHLHVAARPILLALVVALVATTGWLGFGSSAGSSGSANITNAHLTSAFLGHKRPPHWRMATRGPIIPKGKTLWGAFVAMGHYGTNRQSAQEEFEAQVGRQNSLEREYYSWDDAWPNVFDYWSRDQGHTMLISWGAMTTTGGWKKWSNIANGKFDADIDRVAEGIKDFGAPMFFIFNHEPENDPLAGNSTDFVNAYKHIHDRFAADGVTNVSYVLTLMAYTFRQDAADKWYPGDSYVDYIAADGYNWYGCTGRDDPWQEFDGIFSDFYDYGVDKNKPMLVAEYGTGEDDSQPGRKGEWFDDAAATLKGWPKIRGVAYFNNGYGDPACARWVDTSTSSLNAFIDMGEDAFYNPVMPPPPAGYDAYVGASDDGYSAPVGTVYPGITVDFLVQGPDEDHSFTDASGMDWYDSGELSTNSAWQWTYFGAGNYKLTCTVDPSMALTIRIPPQVAPSSGKTTTNFKVTWAAAPPPSGFTYTVRIERPGEDWEVWKDSVTTTSANFVPDSGKGTYSFKARMTRVSTGKSSWYSEAVPITVS
jgi:plastocyanin